VVSGITWAAAALGALLLPMAAAAAAEEPVATGPVGPPEPEQQQAPPPTLVSQDTDPMTTGWALLMGFLALVLAGLVVWAKHS